MIVAELFITIAEYVQIDDLKNVSLVTREINTLFDTMGIIDVIKEYETIKGSEDVFIDACMRGHEHLVEYLCRHESSSSLDYGVCIASANGHLNIVKCLHKKGADLSSFDNSPIEDASYKGHLDVVMYLHENGVDISADILELAVAHRQINVVKYLHQNGAPIELCIPYASRDGDLELIKYLHKVGVDLSDSDIVPCACIKGRLDVIKYFHEEGLYMPKPFLRNYLRIIKQGDISDYIRSILFWGIQKSESRNHLPNPLHSLEDILLHGNVYFREPI